MRTRDLGLIAWIVGGLIAIAFAFIEPTPKARWDAFDRLIQVLTAAGTVGAVAWGMWLSRRQQAEQLRRETQAAVIQAAGIVGSLRSAVERTRAHADGFELMFESHPEADQRFDELTTNRAQALAMQLGSTVFQHDYDGMARLAPLPNMCAARLYQSICEIRRLRDDHERLVNQDWWPVVSSKDRIDNLFIWAQGVQLALEPAIVVMGDIESFVEKAGVHITDEERWGDLSIYAS